MPQEYWAAQRHARELRERLERQRHQLGADLYELGQAVVARADSERELTDAVAASRERGRTWKQIAAVLHLTPQSVRRRFLHRREERP